MRYGTHTEGPTSEDVHVLMPIQRLKHEHVCPNHPGVHPCEERPGHAPVHHRGQQCCGHAACPCKVDRPMKEPERVRVHVQHHVNGVGVRDDEDQRDEPHGGPIRLLAATPPPPSRLVGRPCWVVLGTHTASVAIGGLVALLDQAVHGRQGAAVAILHDLRGEAFQADGRQLPDAEVRGASLQQLHQGLAIRRTCLKPLHYVTPTVFEDWSQNRHGGGGLVFPFNAPLSTLLLLPLVVPNARCQFRRGSPDNLRADSLSVRRQPAKRAWAHADG
mmetsp:Transcript_16061/g.37571  ORF Transcript_16061/g.37571 Transcript_16061/m.37571 type:complete len:274 (-) Transcript_16061:87-908(-)